MSEESGGTARLRERQARHVLFTWSAQRDAMPLDVDRGEGPWFWTHDGTRWLDMASQVFNAHLGFGHPRMVAAVEKQVRKLAVAHPSALFEAKARLGERLAAVMPEGLDRFFFTLGGAEANENALKIARMVTGRTKVVARYRSYHGATFGALSLTGDPRRLAVEPVLGGVVRVEDPYCYRCPWGAAPGSCARQCVAQVERIVEMEGPDQIAAIFVEAIGGTAGGYVPPPDYLPALRALCDRHGILLVCDEVLTGFGRTGRWFAFDHFGVVPDIVTMAKGLTAGYAPLGAVAVRREIAAHFDERVLWSGLTQYGWPVGCAVAAEALGVYRDEGLVERAARLEGVLRARLEPWVAAYAHVGAVRCRGMYAVVELVADRATRTPLARRAEDGPSEAALKAALRAQHVHAVVRNGKLFVAPPLNIAEDALKEGLRRVEAAVAALHERQG